KNSETTKWSKIVPLFRTSKEHSESIPTMAILLQQYELCLFNANIDTESNVFFMSGKNIAPDEFVHFIENDIQLPPYTQAQVKYFDEDEVTFSPVKVGSLITPHSLRAMIDSVYSPALGEKIVSQLMTGQTEAAVGYYTVELDVASSDLLHHMSSLMNLSGRRIANNISLDKADFLNRLSKGTAEEDYQTISLSFGHDIPNLDSDLPSTGLSALRLATASDLAFNRTHICPFNNKCPRSIVIEIGEFSCSNCPYTVTTTNHIPAIAGEIRRLSEPLVSANKKLKNTLQDSVDMEKLKA
ncbi:hypothetical protein H5202_23475, partial [Shewanella sp. SG41-4]|uniref:hypothetical protein n=1 Tax=Shewanella sp. SG41-4 TaxID=2760976 RepID=UPI0015FFF7B9